MRKQPRHVQSVKLAPGQTWERETIIIPYLEDHVRSKEDIEEQHHYQHVESRNQKPYIHIQTDIIQQQELRQKLPECEKKTFRF